MWLSYDDMSGEWIVNGKWGETISQLEATVVGSESPSVGSAFDGTGWDMNAFGLGGAGLDGYMGVWYDNMMGDYPLAASEGELFRFEYTGSSVPCLQRYSDE